MATSRRALGSVAVLLWSVGGGAALPNFASAAEAGDALEGKVVFSDRCSSCHEYPSDFGLTEEEVASDAASPPKGGPSLTGLLGRWAGSLPEYFYSDSMMAADVIWTEETLRTFLLSPRSFIRYNRMMFSGIKSEDDVDDLIAYLAEAAKPAVAAEEQAAASTAGHNRGP
jgi:S-disulfanyl-L-cysteine oxidoreductase SoxD